MKTFPRKLYLSCVIENDDGRTDKKMTIEPSPYGASSQDLTDSMYSPKYRYDEGHPHTLYLHGG